MKINVFEKLSLQQKILSMVIGASTIVLIFAVGNISLKSRKESISSAIKHINVVADYHVSEIKGILEKDLFIARTLSNSIQAHKLLPEDKWKELFSKLYEETLIKNPELLSVWDSWELNYIDPTYKKDYGRYECFYWREKGQIKHNTDIGSVNGDPVDYARIKREKTESLEDPYFYSYTNDNRNQFLMTSIIVSNLVEGRFIGVIGIDIELSRYYDDIRLIKPYENSYAFLLSNNIKYVAHPNKEKIGQNALDDYESIFSKYDVTDKISSGEPAFFTATDINGVTSFFSVKPIIIGKSKPWSLVMVVPKAEVVRVSVFNFWESIIIGLVGIIILLFITYTFSKKFIVSPISRIVDTLQRISLGHVDLGMIYSDDQKDEMGRMFNYLNINVKGLSQKTDFAERIGAGDLDINLDLLSEEDTLGKSLINMRESLKNAKIEEEKRKIEDEKRRWTNEGLAKFSDILRQNNDKLESLAADIIKNLVHYLDANQGGVFIYNDDIPSEVHFELLSAFAFNRHKYLKKQILLGEGLVGTCALEKQTIYLTEIPENYIQITSGLGEARPRCLLIVPLLIDEKVLGVLEIASFSEIEEFKIEFVEKLAQSIASTLTSARTNIKTALLLSRTQQQAEEMSAQEEEMRQNMEELQSTQEEMERLKQDDALRMQETLKRNEESRKLLIELLNSIPAKISLKDENGVFIIANSHFASGYSKSVEEIIGTTDYDNHRGEDVDSWRKQELEIMNKGSHTCVLEDTSGLKKKYLRTTKMPFIIPTTGKTGLLSIQFDISDIKHLEEEMIEANKVASKQFLDMQNYIDAISSSIYVVEYDVNGNITHANKHYLDLIGLSFSEILGTRYSDRMDFTEEQKVENNKFWSDLRSSQTLKTTIRFTVNGKLYTSEETYIPLVDENGDVYKVIKIANIVNKE
ncbi:MAG: GAF domain-containing protein [Bacteroidales bacterium]|nr:GAF domain-containing protein [Bacteroidales bacterium]